MWVLYKLQPLETPLENNSQDKSKSTSPKQLQFNERQRQSSHQQAERIYTRSAYRGISKGK